MFVSDKQCKSQLGKAMVRARTDRPDEWVISEWVKEVELMSEENAKLHTRIQELEQLLLAFKGGARSE